MKNKMKHPLYCVWRSMIDRCRNKNNRSWHNYGGRGIRVCDEWTDFDKFIADMGERPIGFSIDRIDNDGHYCPSNCRWASKKEQQRNRRVVRRVCIDGMWHSAVELAEQSGLKTDTIIQRAKNGLPLAEVLDKTPRRNLDGLRIGGIISGQKNRERTHCRRGHLFDENNTGKAITQNGSIGRRCKACHALRERERRKLKQESHLWNTG